MEDHGNICVVDQTQPSAQALEQGIRVLGGQGVVVVPTDSVYGLAAAVAPANAGHERIFEIKRRDRAQTLPLLIADPEDLDVFGAGVAPWAQRVAREFWPGALTLVVNASDAVPADYRAADGSVALRVPDSMLVRKLARKMGGALAVTSANTHGAPSPASFDKLEPSVAAAADLVYDAGAAPVGVASTIIDARGDDLRVLRAGAIDLSVLKETCHDHDRGDKLFVS
jgi:tRNA threonylcarbamoyl adenosine modification protein (Sua5/YciO/YrdC/YwlC family)